MDHQWWNGFVYSRWQLLDLEWLEQLLRFGVPRRFRQLNAFDAASAAQRRQRAILLLALEARYLPELTRPRVHLRSADSVEWHRYVRDFDPAAVLRRLGVDRDVLPGTAGSLVATADRLDALEGQWRELVARGTRKSWDSLGGPCLMALDHRLAAEILLRCDEDLPSRASPLPVGKTFNRPDRRISHRGETLDNVLARLGLSPHPRVVLIVEGHTEEQLFPRVRDTLGIPDSIEAMRFVTMRGIKENLSRLIALASAPLISAMRDGDLLRMARPPCYSFVMVDPEGPFETPAMVRNVRRLVTKELQAVAAAQGYFVSLDELAQLVRIHTWAASCFEFAHFTDDELADAVVTARQRRSPVGFTAEIARARSKGSDVKSAWAGWARKPSKVRMAEALWPILEAKVVKAMNDQDAPVPPVAQAILDAYDLVAQVHPGTYSLKGRPLAN